MPSNLRFRKTVIEPGTYYPGGKPTPIQKDRIRKWAKQSKEWLDAGGKIPVPYHHTDEAVPIMDENPTDVSYFNSGFVEDLSFDENTGKLDLLLKASTEADADAWQNKVQGLSIRARPWAHGTTGQQWDDVITHVAAVTHPVYVNERPFVPADSAGDSAFLPHEGLALSMQFDAVQFAGTPAPVGPYTPSTQPPIPLSPVITLDSVKQICMKLGLDLGPGLSDNNLLERLFMAASNHVSQMEGGEQGQSNPPEGSRIQQPTPIAMSQTDPIQFAMQMKTAMPNATAEQIRAMYDAATAGQAGQQQAAPVEFSQATPARQQMEKTTLAATIGEHVRGGTLRTQEARAYVTALQNLP